MLVASEAEREGIWLQCLFNDFTGDQNDHAIVRFPETNKNDSPQLLYIDNQSTMKLVISSVNQVHERNIGSVGST
jgi:hypothetical protein